MIIEKLPILTLEAIVGLKGSMRGDDEYFVEAIERNECELWKVGDDSYMITRIEINKFKDDNLTLVICCFGGRNIWKAFDRLRELSKLNGYGGIRFHTDIPHDKVLKMCPAEIDISDVKQVERVYYWDAKNGK